MKEITSKNNETVKFIKSLGLAKTRKKEKLFIVEGMRFVKDAIAYGITPKLLCATNSVDISFFTGCEKILVSENVFRYISDVKSPQGILGVFELPIYELKNFSGEKVVYMQGVQMSENVGAVIRSAACCGFDAVFIDNCTADAFSPKSIRASAANIFKIKIFTNVGLEDLKEMKKAGFSIVGAHLKGKEELYINSEKIILAVGNEGNGLTDDITDICNNLVRIPISPDCESLNVACAATLLMYKIKGY